MSLSYEYVQIESVLGWVREILVGPLIVVDDVLLFVLVGSMRGMASMDDESLFFLLVHAHEYPVVVSCTVLSYIEQIEHHLSFDHANS
jgi:hypothetical protein